MLQLGSRNSSKFNKSCTAWFQSQCHNHSVFWTDAVYFSLKVHETPLPAPGKPLVPWTLGQFKADLVSFLLAVSVVSVVVFPRPGFLS